MSTAPEKPGISDLESPIHDALRMASILSSMLEHKFSSSSDGPNYHLTSTETDDLLFAAYHTELLLGAVLAKWEEVA